METGSVKKVITLIVGILVAFFVADALTNAVVALFNMDGWIGGIVSFVVYAVFFFAVLHLLEKYAHIVFFGFDR
ncbi:MAG: hypothetical protein EHM53_03680 [Methanoregulaceae archaeon]|nr:MAG: hypothetical protein EHM53_03680 [Methanoregulaceae archaeon]